MHKMIFSSNIRQLYIIGIILFLILLGIALPNFLSKYFPDENIIKGEYVKLDDEIISLKEFNNLNSFKDSRYVFCYANKKNVDLTKLTYIQNLENLYIYDANINTSRCDTTFRNLKGLFLKNCYSANDIQINSKKIEKISLSGCNFPALYIYLPKLHELDLSYQTLDRCLIDAFKKSDKIYKINLSGAKNVNLETLKSFKNLRSLNIKDAEVIDYNNLKELISLNELYIDSNVDKKYKSFLKNRFKNGDLNTVSDFLAEKYQVKLR